MREETLGLTCCAAEPEMHPVFVASNAARGGDGGTKGRGPILIPAVIL